MLIAVKFEGGLADAHRIPAYDGTKPGSFETLYEIAYDAAVIGGPVAAGLASGVAGNLLTDLLKTVYRRVTGSAEPETPESVSELEANRAGDVAALVDAVEPAVRLGHNGKIIQHFEF
eukprot:gene17870-18099_t